MPIAFSDFNASHSSLADDHHHDGSHKFTTSGKVGTGSATYEIEASTDSASKAPISWSAKLASASNNSGCFKNFAMTFDHEGSVSKELEFACDKLGKTSKLTWTPKLGATGGCNFGDVKLNISGCDWLDLNLATDDLPSFSKLDLNASLAPFGDKKCEVLKSFTLGLQTSFNPKNPASILAKDAGNWGFYCKGKGLEMAYESPNLGISYAGKASCFKSLEGNSNFSAYGLNLDTADHKSMTLSAQTTADASGNFSKFKINAGGRLGLAKIMKLNQSAQLTLNADVNLADMNAGGHKFGFGLNFE